MPLIDELRDLHERLLTAWNERDAEWFAELFAEDGALVGFDGSQVAGPEIAAHLKPIFADHPTAAYVAKVRRVRALGPDTALLQAAAAMIPPGAADLEPGLNAVQTVVAERSGGVWRVVLFQNTPARYDGRPELSDAHTAELRAVVAAGVIVA